MKIYVASSWKTDIAEVIGRLRAVGHDVYDFKEDGFGWSEIAEHWKEWTPEEYLTNLSHPHSKRGFSRDMSALCCAEACIMVMPCGLSAGLELGWAAGAGKKTAVYVPAMRDPDLMVKMAHFVTTDLTELVKWSQGMSSVMRNNWNRAEPKATEYWFAK